MSDIKRVVRAFVYDGDFMGSDGKYYVPEWAVQALKDETLRFENGELILENSIVPVGYYIFTDESNFIGSLEKSLFEENFKVAQ